MPVFSGCSAVATNKGRGYVFLTKKTQTHCFERKKTYVRGGKRGTVELKHPVRIKMKERKKETPIVP